jgi:uncharacterized protein YycO
VGPLFVEVVKMNIEQAGNAPSHGIRWNEKEAPRKEAGEIPSDHFQPHDAAERPSICRRIFGTIGAALGAVAGRAAAVLGTGAALSMTVGAALGLGPLAAGIGALAGLYLGYKAEKKTRIGRLVGGMIGGAAGIAAGIATSKLTRFTPGKALAEETKGFTYGGLLQKLRNPTCTSHTKLSREEAEKFIKDLKPGDLIITNEDGNFNFEITQKFLGRTGDWTHIGLISEKNTVLEVLIQADGTQETDPLERMTNNHHVIVLRPEYGSPDEIKNVIDEARSYFGKVTYDHKFNMKDDDKLYCQEYIYKVFHKGAPDIDVRPFKILGREFITADEFINSPDMKVANTTGSNFWLNYLSRFD